MNNETTEATMHQPPGHPKNMQHLCNIPTKDSYAESNHKEVVNQPNWEPSCKINWPVIFKKVKVTKVKESKK